MAATLYEILYYLWIAFEIAVAFATRTRAGKGRIDDRGSMMLLWLVFCASIAASETIRARVPPSLFPAAPWYSFVPVACFAAGLAIRGVAIATLGRAFSVNVAIRESQQLKRSGLYRVVRHPSYLGLLLIFLAIGLHARNWLSLAVLMLPATAALLYRIHVEELVLRKAFGSEYKDYSRQTRRLVPGLY